MRSEAAATRRFVDCLTLQVACCRFNCRVGLRAMHCTATGPAHEFLRGPNVGRWLPWSRCWQGLLTINGTVLTAPPLPTPGAAPWCLLHLVVRLLLNEQCTADCLTAAVGRQSSTSILLAPVCLPCLEQLTSITSIRQGWRCAADTLKHCCRQPPTPEPDSSDLSQEGSGSPGVNPNLSPEPSTLGSILASKQSSLRRHGSTVISEQSGLARQGSVAAEGWDGQAQAGSEGGGAGRTRLRRRGSILSPEQSDLARQGSVAAEGWDGQAQAGSEGGGAGRTRLRRRGSILSPERSGLARQGSVAAEGWDGQAQAGSEGGGARRNRRASVSLEDREEQGDRWAHPL